MDQARTHHVICHAETYLDPHGLRVRAVVRDVAGNEHTLHDLTSDRVVLRWHGLDLVAAGTVAFCEENDHCAVDPAQCGRFIRVPYASVVIDYLAGPYRPINLTNVRDFALIKHASQRRKDGSPYYKHVVAVSMLAADFATAAGFSGRDVQCCRAAGLLHDTLEDCQCDYEDLVRVADAYVANTVAALSDDKRLPADERHRQYCSQLRTASFIAQTVKVADCIDNSRAGLALLRSRRPVMAEFMRGWVRRATDNLDAIEGGVRQYRAVAAGVDECRALLRQCQELIDGSAGDEGGQDGSRDPMPGAAAPAADRG